MLGHLKWGEVNSGDIGDISFLDFNEKESGSLILKELRHNGLDFCFRGSVVDVFESRGGSDMMEMDGVGDSGLVTG